MKIIYKNDKIKSVCTNNHKAIIKYGDKVGNKLIDLVNALEAAPNLYDISKLPQYRVHALKGNRKDQISLTIHISSKWRLIIYPLNESGQLMPPDQDETMRFTKTVQVEIEEVSEHYDE